MEPRIQYAKTSDGVSIAFWTLGEGAPLVWHGASGFMSREWEIPPVRSFFERLAKGRRLVRYDDRGTGLSEREAMDFSLNARLLDLEAVVDRLGLERFALFAMLGGGPTAIAYAARHPERVSHLLLWCTYARGAVLSQDPQIQGILDLVDSDWGLFTEAFSHVMLGWSEGERAHSYAAVLRESFTPEALRAAMNAFVEVDVRDALPLVRAPALIIHRREGPMPLSAAQELVAGISDARLVVLEGSSLSLTIGDPEAALALLDEFLGEGERVAGEPEGLAPGRFRTVLFTDLVGHTEMMSGLGDAKGREVLREHERITREVLRAHGGAEVKTMGDGFMASFGSVTRAVECGIALQRAVEERNKGAKEQEIKLAVRCGLNAGEPIEEDGDLFGATVILAARIAAKAEGGEILVANAVRELCAGKGFLFSDRGEFVAKGFEEPVRVYLVKWRKAG